jgi:LysM repeat protein
MLILCLLLVGCARVPAATPAPPADLRPYSTTTPPTPTAGQPEGLVVSFETPLPSPTPFTYPVKSGDTLSQIAERFHVSLDALMAANPEINPSAMSIGQVLKIPSSPQNSTGEGTPTPVPFPVREIACHPTASGGSWCFALVHNDSPDFMENVTGQISLVAPDGAAVASQTALLPLNILPPGNSLPLAAYFAPPIPAGGTPRVQILTAIRLLPGDERYLPATIQNSLAQVDWSGRSAQVSGLVLLPAGSKPASLVWVAAVAYDRAGSVIGFDRWESSQGIPAGGSLPFSFSLASVGGRIVRVEFAVEARP